MRLSNARLCLDCDEVHDQSECPLCASESFAFIKRWVTTPERRTQPRAIPDTNTDVVDTYRQLLAPTAEPHGFTRRLLRGGAVGLALLGAVGWVLRRNGRERDAPTSSPPESTPGDTA